MHGREGGTGETERGGGGPLSSCTLSFWRYVIKVRSWRTVCISAAQQRWALWQARRSSGIKVWWLSLSG